MPEVDGRSLVEAVTFGPFVFDRRQHETAVAAAVEELGPIS